MKLAVLYLSTLLGIGAFAVLRVPLGDRPRSAAPPASGAVDPTALRREPAERGWVGVLIAQRTIDVAPRFSGVVADVKVRPGDLVREGDVLARLDTRALAQLLALAQAEEREEVGRAGRRKKLFEASLASKEDAESVEYQAQAKTAKLQEARVHVDEATLRSPFEGTVVGRFIERGTLVTAGAPGIRIVSTGRPQLRFGLSPEEARAIAIGQTVWFREASTGETLYRGRVRNISSEVDRTVDRVVVDAEADEVPAHYRSGSRVRVFDSPAPGGAPSKPGEPQPAIAPR